jgi:hypothetical protein
METKTLLSGTSGAILRSENDEYEFLYDRHRGEWSVFYIPDDRDGMGRALWTGIGRIQALAAAKAHERRLLAHKRAFFQDLSQSALFNALSVIVLTDHIRDYLKENDPKAYEQALDALGVK